jgi:hypothetical protein
MRSLSILKLVLRCLLLAAVALSVAPARAGDPNVKITLIWGTDDEKPNDPALKPANPQMVAKFRETYKWKHYFEVTNTVAGIKAAPSKIRLSPKCEIELSDTGPMGLAAKLFGENKLLYEGKSKVEPGKHWGFGGNDKNSTAWFVILTPQPPPTASK